MNMNLLIKIFLLFLISHSTFATEKKENCVIHVEYVEIKSNKKIQKSYSYFVKDEKQCQSHKMTHEIIFAPGKIKDKKTHYTFLGT